MIPPTLRGRLLAGLLVLAALGLLTNDLVAYTMLRAFLEDRTDRQLTGIATVLDGIIAQQLPARPARGVPGVAGGPDLQIALVGTGAGAIAPLPLRENGPWQTALRAALNRTVLDRLEARPGRALMLDVSGTPYRASYFPAATPQPGVRGVVVALSFADDQDTLNQLATIEALVSTVALLVLVLLTFVVLRLGLRPLNTMAMAFADSTGPVGAPVTPAPAEVAALARAVHRAFEERSRAEERLRRFLADASHELRTPLTTIQGWADLYFQDGLSGPSDVDMAMSRIADAAGHVSRLVEELLLLARLDEQRPLDTVEVELTGLVSDVVADARVIDPSRPITIDSAGCAGRSTVVGDADRLRQVVRNLVGNAVQHTPAGTPIRVSLRRSGTDLSLSVADGGPGIPEADQERLFERFYRAGNDRGGNGLGLAIVRAVVEAHGGTVSVTSRPGDGTRFDVTLPAPAEELSDAATRQ